MVGTTIQCPKIDSIVEGSGVAQLLGGPLGEGEPDAGAEHGDAWSVRQKPHERERPHHVPGQQHGPQEQRERE